MDSDRYSFKIEFDQYEKGKSYHGLDKLCLNNIIQDNTYMKDYLAYTLMYNFGVDAPLCSYAFLTVNGEDWGLYLAVEAIEDAFLERNYGSNYGDLYKPDAMSFGGGRGNGKDFSMGKFMDKDSDNHTESSDTDTNQKGFAPPNGFGGNMPDFGSEMPQFDRDHMPEGFDPKNKPEGAAASDNSEKPAGHRRTDDTEMAEDSAAAEETVSPDIDGSASQKQRPNGKRPDMGDFSPMNGDARKDNTTAYLLLGVSALVLLIGLGFALRFHR